MNTKAETLLVTTQIDGEPVRGPMSFDRFCRDNSEMGGELRMIAEALEKNGFYQGGGGAAPIFTVRIALASAVALFNEAFEYGFVLPIAHEDLKPAIEIAKLRGRDDIARKLIAAMAVHPNPTGIFGLPPAVEDSLTSKFCHQV